MSSYDGSDKRRETRSAKPIPLTYTKLSEQGILLCMANSETVDMGSSGCCLKLCHQLAPGDLLEIELWPAEGAVQEIQAKIVWLKKERYSETWLAGVKFIARTDKAIRKEALRPFFTAACPGRPGRFGSTTAALRRILNFFSTHNI